MTLWEFHIVFPEGESQEIQHRLAIGDIVDCNGCPLPLPLPTNRMLAYRVSRVRSLEERGVSRVIHYLDQLNATELLEFT